MLSTSCNKAAVGSTPGDSTNIKGAWGRESSKTARISRTGGSTNLGPRVFIMNAETQNVTRSGLKARTIRIRWNSEHCSSHSPSQRKKNNKAKSFLIKYFRKHRFNKVRSQTYQREDFFQVLVIYTMQANHDWIVQMMKPAHGSQEVYLTQLHCPNKPDPAKL